MESNDIMKIIALLIMSLGLLGCSSLGEGSLPKITKFWLKYGPEPTDPQTHRCMIQVIDIEERNPEKLTLRLVRIFVFENGNQKELTQFRQKLALPEEVEVIDSWTASSVRILLTDKNGETKYLDQKLKF